MNETPDKKPKNMILTHIENNRYLYTKMRDLTEQQLYKVTQQLDVCQDMEQFMDHNKQLVASIEACNEIMYAARVCNKIRTLVDDE